MKDKTGKQEQEEIKGTYYNVLIHNSTGKKLAYKTNKGWTVDEPVEAIELLLGLIKELKEKPIQEQSEIIPLSEAFEFNRWVVNNGWHPYPYNEGLWYNWDSYKLPDKTDSELYAKFKQHKTKE